MMKWALDNVPKLTILFVCPVFKHESTNKYRWMLQKLYAKRIVVFLQYKSSLGKAILEREKTAPSHVLWLIIEDAGSSGEAFINCPHAKSLWSVARHVPAHLTIVYHSLRSGSTLNPYIRGNLNVLVMYRVNNLGTVEIFYKELLSLCPQWQNFHCFKNFFRPADPVHDR